MCFEVSEEAQENFWWAFHFHVDARRSVDDPPVQAVGVSQLIDEGAKTDALHHSGDVYLLKENGFVSIQLCAWGWGYLRRSLALANGRLGDDESEHALHLQVYSRLDSEASAWYAGHLPAIDAGTPDPDSNPSPTFSRALAPRFDAWILGWLLAEQLLEPATIESHDHLPVNERDGGGHVPEFFQLRDGAVIDHDITIGELDALL